MLLRISLLVAAVIVLVGCFDMSKSELADASPDGGEDETCGELDWVVSAGSEQGGTVDFARSVGHFPGGGHLVVAGAFREDATFGLGGPYETTLDSLGCHDAFVARYSPGGGLEWARRAGSNTHDEAASVLVTSNDDILITGHFTGPSAVFGAGGETETTLSGAGYHDVFLALYNASGTLIWAEQAGGSGVDMGYAVAEGPEAAPYLVTGSFQQTATFGASSSNPVTLEVTEGMNSMFLAAYGDEVLWAEQSYGAASGAALTTTGDGAVVVTGWFEDNAIFGEPGDNEQQLVSQGEKDVFIACYHGEDGSLAWAKRAGGSGNDEGTALTTLANGFVLAAGAFEDLATFGSGEPMETELTAAGYSDVFFAAYNPDNGELAWVKRAGGDKHDTARGIAVAEGDSFVITGEFMSTATFGPGEPAETLLESAGDKDVYLAHFDAQGELLCARREGGPGFQEEAQAVVSPSEGSIVVAGGYDETVAFGVGEPNETTLSSLGSTDIFVMRISLD
jgi:hypothetical protein